MNLETQLQVLISKGFSAPNAETILLMREALVVLFDAFPDTLLLIGGANLLLFHDSIRLSSDLDLAPLTEPPPVDRLVSVLVDGLEPLSKLMNMTLAVTVTSETNLTRVSLQSNETHLFTIDISRIGAVIPSASDSHNLEATGSNVVAAVRAASRDQLLLHKAEAFLHRRILKVRDAYDIMVLLGRGAALSGNLKQHFEDLLIGEFDSTRIRERIESLTRERCRAELKSILPVGVYERLDQQDFQPLKDAVFKLFEEWL